MLQYGKQVVALRAQGIEAGADDAKILGAIERATFLSKTADFCDFLQPFHSGLTVADF